MTLINMKKPIYLGTREFTLPISKATVYFDTDSLIQFYGKDKELILQLDPSELSILYGSYMQMCREENNEK